MEANVVYHLGGMFERVAVGRRYKVFESFILFSNSLVLSFFEKVLCVGVGQNLEVLAMRLPVTFNPNTAIKLFPAPRLIALNSHDDEEHDSILDSLSKITFDRFVFSCTVTGFRKENTNELRLFLDTAIAQLKSHVDL